MFRIREIRERRGDLTLPDLAARVGMDPGYLSKVERGLQKPSIDKLVEIADALGVKVHELFDTYRPPPPHLAVVTDAIGDLTPERAVQVAELVRAITGGREPPG